MNIYTDIRFMDTTDDVQKAPFTAKDVEHNALKDLEHKPSLIVLPSVTNNSNFCGLDGCE